MFDGIIQQLRDARANESEQKLNELYSNHPQASITFLDGSTQPNGQGAGKESSGFFDNLRASMRDAYDSNDYKRKGHEPYFDIANIKDPRNAQFVKEYDIRDDITGKTRKLFVGYAYNDVGEGEKPENPNGWNSSSIAFVYDPSVHKAPVVGRKNIVDYYRSISRMGGGSFSTNDYGIVYKKYADDSGESAQGGPGVRNYRYGDNAGQKWNKYNNVMDPWLLTPSGYQ